MRLEIIVLKAISVLLKRPNAHAGVFARPTISMWRCFGCYLCRRIWETDVIKLVLRESVSVLCDIIASFHSTRFSGLSGFAALLTALFTKFKISLLTCENCFSGFVAQFTWLLATRLSTQLSDERATVAGIIYVESHSISAHKQTELPS